MFTDRLGVAQIMMTLDQTAEESILRGSPNLSELKFSELAQVAFNPIRIAGRHRLRAAGPNQWIGRGLTRFGQPDQSRPMPLKHHPPTDHVPKGSIGLNPVPCFTQPD
jgi:hypothetical protein